MGTPRTFFNDLESWKKEWKGMPEFIQEDNTPHRTILLHFENEGDIETFNELVGQKITQNTKFIYFPKLQRANLLSKKCIGKGTFAPRFPLYIPSKGRWESRLTSKALDAMNVPYHLVIERQEYKNYVAEVPKSKLLILDKKYQDEYDTCDDLGSSKSKGSGPARNFIWEHAISEGHKWHWIMDDNITEFYRLNRNIKYRVTDGTIFRCMEDFVLRYENIVMAGPQYELFVPRKTVVPPFILNTRIYSCNLIRNDVPYRWRGRYNEDTDLSLRMLEDGYCTVLFNAFLQNKMGTMRMSGGNTDELYKGDTLPKSEMQVKLHPNVSTLITRWNRPHHFVDYSIFKKNKLVRKKNEVFPEENNEYEMLLKTIL